MTLVEPAEISKLSDVEQQLIRLWRCLPSQAQDKSLFKVARALLDQNPELFHIDIGDEGVDSNERFDWFLHDCVYLAHDEADMIDGPNFLIMLRAHRIPNIEGLLPCVRSSADIHPV